MMTNQGMQAIYNNLRIVLVGTTHPGNIGAAARAMKNMCLSQLRLVQPASFPHAEATARASGADDILASAQVYDSLREAVADCALVIGASARQRTIPWPVLDPRGAAHVAVEAAASQPVALVFGREHAGLTNAELDHCQYLLHIPANPAYSSLNLGAAVQVVTYECHTRLLQLSGQGGVAHDGAGEETEHGGEARLVSDQPLATADDLEGLYTHMEQTLIALDFLAADNPRQLMRRLRRLFGRARPDRMEVNILRGMCSAAQKIALRRS